MPTGPRPPIPPGVARVAISGTTMTHKWVMVFYLQITGGTVTVNDLQSVANEIDSLYNSNINPLVPSTVTMTDIKVVYVPSVGNEVVFEGNYSRTGIGAGTQVADASACFVVNWHISAYYRGGHPRTYMTGVTTTEITNGSDLSSTATTAVSGGWNAFRNALNAFTTTNISTIVMGTLSFQSGNVWRATPLFRAYTSVSTRSKLGSQRRRILT